METTGVSIIQIPGKIGHFRPKCEYFDLNNRQYEEQTLVYHMSVYHMSTGDVCNSDPTVTLPYCVVFFQ